MGKVYQSVREVVQGTLHRRKPDITVSAQAKGNDGSLNDAMEELEKIFVDGIGRLKAAVSDDQAVVASEAQHTEQVIEGLKADIAVLEAKLRETEDTVHRKDVASQKMEETLRTEIRDLQSVVKKKEEALESRDSEVNDLKSKTDVLVERVTHLELAIQQAKGEAASEAQHAEQVIEGLKANIAVLEAKLRETEDAVHRKDVASQKTEETLRTEIRDLQSVVKKKEEALESRDSEVNDLKSKTDVLVERVTHLELAIQQAKGETASEAQRAEQVIEGLKVKIATLEAQLTQTEQIGVAGEQLKTGEEKPAIPHFQPAGVTSIVTEAARETVSPDVFDRMIAEFSELTNVIGSIASLIVRDHVRALGESMEEFPQTRLAQLLESLSKEISDDKLKADFRERLLSFVMTTASHLGPPERWLLLGGALNSRTA